MSAYTYQYSQCWGMERSLVVLKDGEPIGQRDPFWPKGIPASKAARTRRLNKVAREIIAEYESRVTA